MKEGSLLEKLTELLQLETRWPDKFDFARPFFIPYIVHVLPRGILVALVSLGPQIPSGTGLEPWKQNSCSYLGQNWFPTPTRHLTSEFRGRLQSSSVYQLYRLTVALLILGSIFFLVVYELLILGCISTNVVCPDDR